MNIVELTAGVTEIVGQPEIVVLSKGDATSGTFKINGAGSAIDIATTAGNDIAAIVGSVAGGTWNADYNNPLGTQSPLTFTKTTNDANVALSMTDNNTDGTPTVTVTQEGIAYVAPVNEVHTFTHSTANFGLYFISFGGYWTGGLAYNVPDIDILQQLEALASIGAGNISVSGDAITFIGALAGQPIAGDFTWDDYTTQQPTAAEVQDGVFFGPNATTEGTYDPMAAAVFPLAADVSTTDVAYGPTGAEYAGALDITDYQLKTASVLISAIDAATIVTGTVITATSGATHVDGTYPTTATTEAAQRAADEAEAATHGDYILSGRTVLGTPGAATLPAVGKVDTTNGAYGVGGTGSTPTLDLTDLVQDNIKDGVTINAILGTFTHTADYTLISALVIPAAGKVDTTQGDYGIPGSLITPTLNMSTFCLISSVVEAEWVVIGNVNRTGGDAGTYPTTATSKAEQLAADQAAVLVDAAKIKLGTTVLSQPGAYDYVAAIAAGYEAGMGAQYDVDRGEVFLVLAHIEIGTTLLGYAGALNIASLEAAAAAAQLTTDRAAVAAVAGSISSAVVGLLGTVDGTLNLSLRVLKTDVAAAGDVRLNTPRWAGATGIDLGTLVVGGGGAGGATGLFGVSMTI